jgi:hypothetical protein
MRMIALTKITKEPFVTLRADELDVAGLGRLEEASECRHQ